MKIIGHAFLVLLEGTVCVQNILQIMESVQAINQKSAKHNLQHKQKCNINNYWGPVSPLDQC